MTLDNVHSLLFEETRPYIGSFLENTGSILAPFWRMWAVYWLQSAWRKPAVYIHIGSCLENAGCILVPVWRMQAVNWLPSGECKLYIGSCLEDSGCTMASVWRMQAIIFLS